MPGRDVISIDGLQIDCVVGVYPHERDITQPLRVDLEMHLDTSRASKEQKLGATVDYAATASQIAFLLQSCRFLMLETAAYALCAYLLAPPAAGERRAPVERVRIRLTKPYALGGRGTPSLLVERTAEELVPGREEKPFGHVDVIHETKEAGIYRLNVAPGRAIPMHVHRVMRESEMVLGDGLLCQGVLAERGSVRRWPHDAPHTYENPSQRYQTILCVDSPAFVAADEVEMPGAAAAEIRPEPPFIPW